MPFPLATERDKVLRFTSVPGSGYLEGAGGEPKEYKVREPPSTKRRNFLAYTWGSSIRACCSACLVESSSTLELAQMDRQAWLLARCTPSVIREYRVLELQLQDRVFE